MSEIRVLSGATTAEIGRRELLAYCDIDIYKSTKACLGTIGLGKYGLRRDPQNPLFSWMVID